MAYDFSTDPDGFTPDDFTHERDGVLNLLRGFALDDQDEDSRGSFGVTVIVKGCVISGIAISFGEWGDLLSESLRPDVVDEGFSTFFKEKIRARADMIARRDSDERPTPSPQILCLKEAHLIQAGELVHLGLTRVCISEIDGWSPNHITQPQ